MLPARLPIPTLTTTATTSVIPTLFPGTVWDTDTNAAAGADVLSGAGAAGGIASIRAALLVVALFGAAGTCGVADLLRCAADIAADEILADTLTVRANGRRAGAAPRIAFAGTTTAERVGGVVAGSTTPSTPVIATLVSIALWLADALVVGAGILGPRTLPTTPTTPIIPTLLPHAVRDTEAGPIHQAKATGAALGQLAGPAGAAATIVAAILVRTLLLAPRDYAQPLCVAFLVVTACAATPAAAVVAALLRTALRCAADVVNAQLTRTTADLVANHVRTFAGPIGTTHLVCPALPTRPTAAITTAHLPVTIRSTVWCAVVRPRFARRFVGIPVRTHVDPAPVWRWLVRVITRRLPRIDAGRFRLQVEVAIIRVHEERVFLDAAAGNQCFCSNTALTIM